jgi:hypothetical protein
MDPFAKKMVGGSLAFAAGMLALFAVLTGVYLHERPPCSDQIISETVSSGKLQIAAVMERRCGDETSFFTHVNLRAAADPVKLEYFTGRAKDGEIFVVEEDARSAGVTLQWISSQQLIIHCSGCAGTAPKKREQRWHDVEITYDFR